MRYLYADGNPSILTLKRLILVSKELTFIEQAGFALSENYFIPGKKSPIEDIIKDFDNSPLKVDLEYYLDFYKHEDLLKTFFLKDVQNPNFIDISISNQLSSVSGEQKKWLIAHKDKILNYDYSNFDFLEMNVYSAKDPLPSFALFLYTESVRLSNILVFCSKNSCMPISQDPYFLSLLNTRLLESNSSKKSVSMKHLGLKLMDCFIPDEALNNISGPELINFRTRINDYFDAFAIEINKIEATMLKEGLVLSDKDIDNLVNIELNPRLQEIRNEILKIRNDMFKNILKFVKNFFISGVMFSSLVSINFWGALSSFLLSNLKSPKFLDSIIDNKVKINEVYKSNSLAYLLKIHDNFNKGM